MVACEPDAIARIQADGTCWAGGTVWHGRSALRISVSGYATTTEDVERSAEAILSALATPEHVLETASPARSSDASDTAVMSSQVWCQHAK